MITIEGIVEEIIYQNHQNGYLVCEFGTNDSLLVVVGNLPLITLGDTLRLQGDTTVHPVYGEQFKVVQYEKILPETPEAIRRYLSSGVVKGVGPQTAQKIIKHFGENTIQVIRSEPKRLTEIRGISLEKAYRISESFLKQKNLEELLIFLQSNKIEPYYFSKINHSLGENSMQKIRSNPYLLTEDEIGVDFRRADTIAIEVGVDFFSEYRIGSGILFALRESALQGHTYLFDEELHRYCIKILQVNEEHIENGLVHLNISRQTVTINEGGKRKIYLARFYDAEMYVAANIAKMSRNIFQINETELIQSIRQIESTQNIQLEEKQRKAIMEAVVNEILIITGGPGTGKTTIIKTMIQLFIQHNVKVMLTAPTGKATRRLSEVTGMEAKTIHRLLEIGYSSSRLQFFERNEEKPLETDVLIVDEVSMVDIMLFHHLLRAIPKGAKLIIVGDADQLPSVGAGNVLSDLLLTENIPCIRLTEIFRQASKSMIVVNAHRINEGLQPILNQKEADFFFMNELNEGKLSKTIVELVKFRLPKAFEVNAFKDIQVITPTRKGPWGVKQLNKLLQLELNPPMKNKCEKEVWGTLFREGDKVIHTKNNYELEWHKDEESIAGLGVYNGDCGFISEINLAEEYLKVCFEDGKQVIYTWEQVEELELAYALTVHKSQGSEFPLVVIPVYKGPEILLTRNLIYTAITRAQHLVVLVGDKSVLTAMIKNNRQKKRNSDLKDMTLHYMQEYQAIDLSFRTL